MTTAAPSSETTSAEPRDAAIHTQAQALAERVGTCRQDHRMVVRITGEDRVSWLNGQLTNDVRELVPRRGVYALAATVKGRIMADVWVVTADDHIELVLPRAACESVLASFDKYIIMEDVELEPRPEQRVWTVQGPRADDVVETLDPKLGRWAACDELGHGGYLLWTGEKSFDSAYAQTIERCEALGGCAVEEAGWELARIRAGRPRFGRDFGMQHYPQEAGLKERAVSFQKGCYLGQEVVCMLENRGQVSRRLVRLDLLEPATRPASESADDHRRLPAPETPLFHDGREVGKVTSAVWDPAHTPNGRLFAYVKRAAAEPDTELALDSGGRVRVEFVIGEPPASP